MKNDPPTPIVHWSTQDVPERQRLDYWISALGSALIPLYVKPTDASPFTSEMQAAALGPLTLVRQSGSRHECGRRREELARTSINSFNLLMSLDEPYTLRHRADLRLGARDLALVDSEYACDILMQHPYEFINIAIPVDWLRTWVSDPNWLIGRRVAGDSSWGRALSSFVTQLTPSLSVAPPLAPTLIADQLGALLALTAKQISNRSESHQSVAAERSLYARIIDCIDQRCQEANLSAEDIATSVGISVRTLHRAFAATDETFGARLIKSRLTYAARMLQAPAFNRVTVAEIARRAGFATASHMTRVMRGQLGVTPIQLRLERGLERTHEAAEAPVSEVDDGMNVAAPPPSPRTAG